MSEHGLPCPVAAERLALLADFLYEVAIYAFGSWAQGQHFSQEIDLVVVAPNFAGVVSVERTALVRSILESTELIIDPICLTPNEFDRLLSSHSAFAITLKSNLVRLFERGITCDQ